MFQAMKAAKADMQAAGITMSPVSAEEMAWIKVICGE
jgi:hypothetical protein